MPFSAMPIGTIVHNVEMKPGKGGQIARSAGTYAQFVGRDGGYAQIKLSSGELSLVRARNAWRRSARCPTRTTRTRTSARPGATAEGHPAHVRGVVMNPIDHPHGGGEGRTSGGRHPVTPWGKPTKGARTRKNKATTKFILRSRHQKKKR
jgi:large subunit ribosomal protein L2